MSLFLLFQPFTLKYVLDSCFSHFFLLGLTVLSWQGMWNVLGSFIYPDDATFSDFFCLALGYALLFVLFLTEELLAAATVWISKHGFYCKLIWEDVVYTAVFICTGILWRGGWNLTATYVIPDIEVGGWVCFVLGSVLLISLQLLSFVCCHGIAMDGTEPGREAFYPTKYLRVYLHKYTEKQVWLPLSHLKRQYHYHLNLSLF